MTKTLAAASLALALAAVGTGATAMAIEQPSYRVEKEYAGFEIRVYEPYVVAETRVSGDFGDAGNAGFRRLADFIFGGNSDRTKIAMTAPVAQMPLPDEAVRPGVSPSGKGEWLVSFSMPSSFSPETLPSPVDKRVTIRQVAGQKVAALAFSGTWSGERFTEHSDALTKMLQANGYVATGPAVYARYDPPWTLWFARRNEILIPVH